MLDKRKVRLMTRLAMYEQNQGKEDLKISEYYRKDYTGIHVFSTILWVTVGYACVAALIVLAGLEAIIGSMSGSFVIMLGIIFVIGYIGTIIIFIIITSHVYNQKHKEARMRVKKYNHNLTRLLKWYERENG